MKKVIIQLITNFNFPNFYFNLPKNYCKYTFPFLLLDLGISLNQTEDYFLEFKVFCNGYEFHIKDNLLEELNHFDIVTVVDPKFYGLYISKLPQLKVNPKLTNPILSLNKLDLFQNQYALSSLIFNQKTVPSTDLITTGSKAVKRLREEADFEHIQNGPTTDENAFEIANRDISSIPSYNYLSSNEGELMLKSPWSKRRALSLLKPNHFISTDLLSQHPSMHKYQDD